MNIKVCDALCGSGKTSACIRMMNERTNSRFIFVTQFLSEVERIKARCSKREFISPEREERTKLSDIKLLLREKRNIATTHALFLSSTEEVKQLLRDGKYVLVLDETVDVLQMSDLKQCDMNLLLRSKIVTEEDGKLEWADEDYERENFDGEGLFSHEVLLAKSKNLMKYKDEYFFWTLPPDLFSSFEEVYVLTYMFHAQPLNDAFDKNSERVTGGHLLGGDALSIEDIEAIKSYMPEENLDGKKTPEEIASDAKEERVFAEDEPTIAPQDADNQYQDIPIVDKRDPSQSYDGVQIPGIGVRGTSISSNDLEWIRGQSSDVKGSSYMTYATAKIYGYTYGLSEEEWYKAFGKETTLAGFKAGLYKDKIPKVSVYTGLEKILNEAKKQSNPSDYLLNQGVSYATAKANGYATGYTANEWRNRQKARGITAIYHSGGIVDTSPLKSTEIFAKLLKGEFVATPTMMQKFVGQTLPAIASSSNSTNEFNAPLITIQCDNVTQESLPRLEEIIDGAVQKIKKELDGGMSRSGYRKSVKSMV